MSTTILIIDDKQSVFDSLALNFRDFGYLPEWAPDTRTALAALERGKTRVVLLDLSLGRENGMDLLLEIKQRRPALPVIMITGYGTLERAVRAMKIGAFDFLPKPLDFDRLRETVEQALAVADGASVSGGKGAEAKFASPCSPALRDIYRRAMVLAGTDLPVLVTGESGTGKEHLVELIHEHSRRGRTRMERINCSAFPETLIDNELFGHEKGAFSGADGTYPGLFERADGGTLHLDEVGDLALSSQARLLRVLEDGNVRRLGGTRNMSVDVRIVTSTNRELPEMIREGRFRQDLFYRLNAAYLYLPPLRERREDLGTLIDFFLDRHPGADGGRKRFSPEAAALLSAAPWPGNIRELRNVVRASVAVAEAEVIDVRDLPPEFVRTTGEGSGSSAPEQLDDAEREHILRALRENRYNKTKTSQRLGIDRKTLYNKMKNYGLE